MRSKREDFRKTGCPILAASLFLRLGWDDAITCYSTRICVDERSLSL